MSDTSKELMESGIFLVAPNHKLNGTLRLDGQRSVLHVWSPSEINIELPKRNIITGTLNDQKNVILLDCVLINGKTTVGQHGITTQYNYFPNIAVLGEKTFKSDRKTVDEISFIIDDAQAIFFDRSAFGTRKLNSEEIECLQSLKIFSDSTFSDKSAILAYFTGKFENFCVETNVGRISANNSVSYSIGSSNGVGIKNEILIHIKFKEPAELREISSNIDRILRFVEILSGRPQKFSRVRIVDRKESGPTPTSVYLNAFRQRMDGSYSSDLHPITALINAVQATTEFEHLIRNWLARDQSWSSARYRFSGGWREERNYSPDRLVGAANMFDLLPEESTGKASPLSSVLEDAVRDCIRRIKQTPDTPRKNEILNALGWTKRQNLKDKIRHRASHLSAKIDSKIPEIELATDAAVDLRNIFVHGTSTAKKRDELPKFQIFLTDTLEFVFAASDLVEAGWDIAAWASEPRGLGHPFGRFLSGYRENMYLLKSALGK